MWRSKITRFGALDLAAQPGAIPLAAHVAGRKHPASWIVTQHVRAVSLGDEVAIGISSPDGGICALGKITHGAEHIAGSRT